MPCIALIAGHQSDCANTSVRVQFRRRRPSAAAAPAAWRCWRRCAGKDKRGDEMPDWASDKEKRLAKIQEAMAALEAEAKLAAEEERRIEAEKQQQRLGIRFVR
jgi:hypothetical protein